MTFVTRMLAWVRRSSPIRPAAGVDTIAERLHAAVEANAHAKVHSSACYERRVHAMIDDLFLRMHRDGGR